MCGAKETTQHILNCCATMLNDGRYLWRHNNIIHYLRQLVNTQDFESYADLENRLTVTGGTIPSNIIITAERPDLTIIDRENKTIYLFELTVPMETRIDAAHDLKLEKYAALTGDLQTAGWKCSNIPFEIGSRGLISKRNKISLGHLIKFLSSDLKPSQIIENVSKLAVLGSYQLYLSRKESSWACPGFLSP